MSKVLAWQDAERILPETDAARLCGMSSTTWRRLLSRGETPTPIQLSPRRRGYRVGDLTRWLDQRQAPPVDDDDLSNMIIQPCGKRLWECTKADLEEAREFYRAASLYQGEREKQVSSS